MSPAGEGAGLGAVSTHPAPLAEQPGRTRQPWLLFQAAITCCLATTQNSWLFVYSISCAELKAQIPNYCVQQHQSCNRWIRKCVFLYLLQDFFPLQGSIRKIYTQSPTHSDARPIWKIFQYESTYFHNSGPLGATSMNKVIHIPIHFNDEVTKADLGPNAKGHARSGRSPLDSITKVCLKESCPCVLGDLIFPNYYLLQVEKLKQKQQQILPQPFCTVLSTWIKFSA